MLNYIIRRLLLMVPTLLGITMLVFFVMALSPGGTGADLARAQGGDMQPEQRRRLEAYLNERYGLNKPLYKQYFRWLNKVSPLGLKELPGGRYGWPVVKKPDLGESFNVGRPVSALILEALPVTLLLNAISIPIIYSLSILMGIQAARHRGQFVDVASGTVLLAFWSIPVIWAGILLQGYLTSSEYIRWFPTATLHDIQADAMLFLPSWGPEGFARGWLLDTLWHLVLPVICLSYGGFTFLAKLARGAVLENISADYVRTARAKGVPEKTVLYVHVLRNSLLPLITVAVHILPGLLAGSVVVETIFAIPGMGRLMVEAVFSRDRELVLSLTLVAGILGLVSYLLADIGYAIADPRVSYE